MKKILLLISLIVLHSFSASATLISSQDEIDYEVIGENNGCVYIDGIQIHEDFPVILYNGFLRKIQSYRLYYTSRGFPDQNSQHVDADFDTSVYPPTTINVKACGFNPGDIVRTRFALLDKDSNLVYFPFNLKEATIP
jgi:hypothetical protein